MEFIALIVIIFVCLLSETTRKLGVFLFILLYLAYPITSIALTAILIHFINRQKP